MDEDHELVTTAAVADVGDRTSVATSLPPHPSAIGAARRFVRAALADAGRNELLDDAELAVSEVVTNALVHAGTSIELTVVVGPVLAWVGVGDGSPHQPRTRRYGTTAGTGRGLRLLTEVTADWGVTPTEGGKTVWFEIAPRPLPAERRDAERARPSAGDRPVAGAGGPTEPVDIRDVTLLEVPVLLYDAWRQHAEALLREYLLATLDDGDPEDAVRVHAEASDALALLDAAIPVPSPSRTATAALRSALSPEASQAQVRVSVPDSSRQHFSTLDEALEDALRRAEAGTFLTPPVQPELRELRRWLCDQVVSQAVGAAPSPWVPPETSPAPVQVPAPDAWDSVGVTSARRPVLAVEDTGRILAVSRPARELLGYAVPQDSGSPGEELSGQRVVALIPERFRQAHLAGFTLHLLTGRDPLLRSPVTVPVLRRDGTEVVVQLTIHEEHGADGRPVFLADLEPRSGP